MNATDERARMLAIDVWAARCELYRRMGVDPNEIVMHPDTALRLGYPLQICGLPVVYDLRMLPGQFLLWNPLHEFHRGDYSRTVLMTGDAK